jgi:hypothetical protein
VQHVPKAFHSNWQYLRGLPQGKSSEHVESFPVQELLKNSQKRSQHFWPISAILQLPRGQFLSPPYLSQCIESSASE